MDIQTVPNGLDCIRDNNWLVLGPMSFSVRNAYRSYHTLDTLLYLSLRPKLNAINHDHLPGPSCASGHNIWLLRLSSKNRQ
jgi:hypothetical protein